MLMLKQKRFAAILALLYSGVAQVSNSAPIVATPGSLAGYTYFPAATSGGGSGSSGAENASTLMRCVRTPTKNDRTINLADSAWYDYDKPITIYYKMWGGDGGHGSLAGGGGSSAILKNGAPVAIGPGGNGGQSAPAVTGQFTATKTDTLRFIVGGGGGGSYLDVVGGGGGAGYKGGGGGASVASGTPLSIPPEARGGGGSNTVGIGGFFTPASIGTAVIRTGTSGSDMTGGVSTYPDGNTSPIGSAQPNGTYQVEGSYDSSGYRHISDSSRHPATTTSSGSYITYTVSYMGTAGAGGGGALGFSGRIPMSFGTQNYNSFWVSSIHTSNLEQRPRQGYATDLAYTENYTRPTDDFNVSRVQKPITRHNGSNFYDISPSGALPGLIAIMYQAPTCELITDH